ncbi:MAG: hypothetical protein Q4C34_02920 [Bacteroidales bacterium]|nr:hypothetical protein [Bacteroidales bacterium]
MSFFSAIKRGLGFSDGDDEDDSLYADTTPEQAESPHQADTNATTTTGTMPELRPVEFDPDKRRLIFDKVVEVFNASLPDFLRRSVDQKAQTDYLLQSLDNGIKDYLSSLAVASQAYCEQQWEQRQATLSAELEAVRTRAGDIEKQSADIKQKQLSADRQKRALADRVHDLESQLGRLEAEREQFELENRSLVNRLKVANVQQDDIDSSRAEAESLRLELKKLRENPDESRQQEIEALRTQIEAMTEGIESLKEQQRVSDEMLADQRLRLAEAKDEAKKRDERLAEMQAELNSAAKKLKEANELIEGFNEVSEKMDEVNQMMARREEKIKSQKQLLASREAEIDSLRKTISENLRLQAEREKTLQDKIETLKKSMPAAPSISITSEAGPDEESAPRISDNDLTDIEQTFESEEWFTKTPPPQTPSMRPADDDPDFGYRPPKRKPQPPHNSDQLTLF